MTLIVLVSIHCMFIWTNIIVEYVIFLRATLYIDSVPSLSSSMGNFHLSNTEIYCTMLLADRRGEEYYGQI
jgi:hypothetical protein